MASQPITGRLIKDSSAEEFHRSLVFRVHWSDSGGTVETVSHSLIKGGMSATVKTLK